MDLSDPGGHVRITGNQGLHEGTLATPEPKSVSIIPDEMMATLADPPGA